MKRNLVMKYDEALLKILKNQHIIVFVDTLDCLEQKYAESQRNNNVISMCIDLPYSSISQIDFSENWSRIPLLIFAYNIGDYNLLFSKLNTIRSLDVRIFVSNDSDTAFTDLKIMSSLGIDCGLKMKTGITMDDDSFLDLASYYYMSPVPHATIEPFNYILRHLTDETSSGFNGAYFEDLSLFAHIASIEDYKEQEQEEQDILQLRFPDYYQHFIDLDNCSKCPAFKICDRKMSNRLKSCQNTMSEVYEYAEIQNEISNRNIPKRVCQL